MRKSGVLLPVFSLPGPYGIGTFGRAAFDWVDFLAAARQAVWQVLPLGATSFADSPYQSFSAFALNPYFIDLDALCEQGLLTAQQCEAAFPQQADARVSYMALFEKRMPLLRQAYAAFCKQGQTAGLDAFCEQQQSWLGDYTLYMAIKQAQGGLSWQKWPAPLRLREKDALQQARQICTEERGFHAFVQYQAYTQWDALKQYANENGVEIIGDLPIYVALDSADVWANRKLFCLDDAGWPTAVAGCPPDAFATDGQLWGNPLYDWPAHESTGFAWWLQRMQAAFTLFDAVRVDHFRGFESYYAIPFSAGTARRGSWLPGPGMAFIHALQARFGNAPIVAEDLGFLTPQVQALLQESGYPGMKVLQFAFDTREEHDYRPYTYPENCVVYTGTHDNDTTAGWLCSGRRDDVRLAKQYLGCTGQSTRQGVWAFLRAAFGSAAALAVIPMQDWLGLGGEARINTPATIGGNWAWRLSVSYLTPALAKEMADFTKLYGRA